MPGIRKYPSFCPMTIRIAKAKSIRKKKSPKVDKNLRLIAERVSDPRNSSKTRMKKPIRFETQKMKDIIVLLYSL